MPLPTRLLNNYSNVTTKHRFWPAYPMKSIVPTSMLLHVHNSDEDTKTWEEIDQPHQRRIRTNSSLRKSQTDPHPRRNLFLAITFLTPTYPCSNHGSSHLIMARHKQYSCFANHIESMLRKKQTNLQTNLFASLSY